MVFAVVGQRAAQFEYGVRGDLDRWTGSAWEHVCATSSSLDFWGGTGSMYAHGWRAIGLRVSDGVGVLEWLHVGGLQPGTYRIRHREVAGEFTVVADDVAVPWPVRRRERPLLGVHPGVVRSGARTLAVVAVVPSGSTDADVDAALGLPAGPLVVQRWQRHAWTTADTLRVDDHPVGDLGNLREFHVRLPALPPGSYQLTRRYASAGTVTGPLLLLPQ